MMPATTLTAEQQELRKGRITSTRIVKLVNGRALAVFNEMMGIAAPVKDNPRMRFGRALEHVIIEAASEDKGWGSVRYQPGTEVYERFASSPDAYVMGGVRCGDAERVVEAKNRSADQAAKYAGNEPTPDEIVQTQWHMGVTGIGEGSVCVLLGGNDLRVFDLRHDEEMWLGLEEIGARFLRDHYDTGRPPPMDASDDAAEYLRARFPFHSAPLLQADDATTNLALELRSVRAERERLEAREGELTNVLKSIIGDAEGVAGPGFKLTWKATKGTKRTDWEAVAHELGASTPVIDRYTTTSPGSRRFVPTWKDN
jgi:predicted phage-related endonuclease